VKKKNASGLHLVKVRFLRVFLPWIDKIIHIYAENPETKETPKSHQKIN